MIINDNNIEELIVDYVDNKLDSKSSQEFLNYIKQNNKYKDLLNFYVSSNEYTIIKENISLNNEFKNNLKHTTEFDYKEVAYYDKLAVLVNEKQASKKEEIAFYKMVLKDNNKISSAGIYANCKIKADRSITFSEKNKLKHKENNKILKMWISIAAVTICLLFGFWNIIKFNEKCFIEPVYKSNSKINNIREIAYNKIEDKSKNEIIINNTKISTKTILPKVKDEEEKTINDKLELQTQTTLIAENTNKTEQIIRQSNFKIKEPEISNLYAQVNEQNENLINENIDFSFIGTEAVKKIKEYKNKVDLGEKASLNPKICLSRNEEGKICKVGIWIGEKQISLWAK
ncbi:MAG: hypothetical protein MJ211_02795 [Bacteroidales bacterium]|nr:hypothetical protein [Bacteroidales bacterium]